MEYLAFMLFFSGITTIVSLFVREFLQLILDGLEYRKEHRNGN